MKKILTLLLLSVIQVSFAQRPQYVHDYLDKYCQPTNDTTVAEFYRLIDEDEHGFIVKDYYMSGELEMEARASRIAPKVVKDGEAKFYARSGQLIMEGAYFADNQRGIFKEYYENGKPKSVTRHDENKTIYYQHWDEAGRPLLQNGNGHISFKHEKSTSYMEIVDSVHVNSYSIMSGSTDTVFTVLDVEPKYPGGYGAMMKDIGKNLKYPRSARKLGLDGIVYVSFVIDPEGNIKDVEVIRGFYNECDDAALNAVKQLRRWKPGRVRDRAVHVRFVIPIKFRLT